MGRRVGVVFALVVLAQGVMGGALAQEEVAASLAVVDVQFVDSDGNADERLFSFGEAVQASLTLRNTGDVTVTGIAGTLDFPRATVLAGSSTWPDIEPGGTAVNTTPFEFSYGEASTGDCFVVFEGLDVGEEEVVDDPSANQVVANDPDTDPSEPFEDIPPGSLTWTITSDQGTVEYWIPFGAICSVATMANGDGGGESTVKDARITRLARTGSTPAQVALVGVGLVLSGLVLRRRPLRPTT